MLNNSTNIYLPGLNGLRAIAALSVVLSHITIAFPDLGFTKTGGWGFATHGVTLFFTISGFLITYLLLLEKKEQIISVKKFYIRRVLRIWPLYYLYLVIAIVCLIVYSQFEGKSILYYVFFCANLPFIFGGSVFLIAHLWSIGVEEQFYLFWPVFVKFTHRWLILIMVLMIILLIGLKFFARYILKDDLFKIFLDVNRFECMLIGAIGAILYFSQNKYFKVILTHISVQISAWIILIIMAVGRMFTPGPTEHVLVSLITLILIIGQICSKNRLVNLDRQLFDFLGKISYGLYVFHPLVIFFVLKVYISLNIDIWLKGFIIYFTVIISSVLLAHLSYKYYEKPFLKLKSRFAIVNSKSSRY